VGVYVLFRFFTLFFVQDQDFWHKLLLIIAGATMLFGGMAASVYYDSRRVLSYHIISQIGYMLLGLGIFTPLAIAGALYFTVHNMIAKTNTFVIAGLIAKKTGTFDLKESGGLLKTSPFLAVLFIIPALALAGVPPVSGFFAKLFLIKGGYEAGYYIITSIAVFTGLLTLYSMVKIWFEAFLKPAGNENTSSPKFSFIQLLPSILLGSASIALGLFASYGYEVAIRAANELFSPDAYINAVLNR
jgi:multicomponent Na+:H+ antiporter subunit D